MFRKWSLFGSKENITLCIRSMQKVIFNETNGHLWASTHAAYDKLKFTKDDGLQWYSSSAFAKRGFCKSCGSSLFYRMNDEEGIGIAAGCLDLTKNLQVDKHIFVKDKADYYEIADNALQIDTY